MAIYKTKSNFSLSDTVHTKLLNEAIAVVEQTLFSVSLFKYTPMTQSQTDNILVAMLPLTPEQGEPKPLVLRYDSSTQKGTFIYGTSSIRMDCYIKVLRSSKGSRNRKEKTVTELADRESIPCSSLPYWLRYPELFSHLQDTDFCVEPSTKLWRKVMRRREITAVYHDTIYETQEITLLLNLSQGTGKLIVYDAREVED